MKYVTILLLIIFIPFTHAEENLYSVVIRKKYKKPAIRYQYITFINTCYYDEDILIIVFSKSEMYKDFQRPIITNSDPMLKTDVPEKDMPNVCANAKNPFEEEFKLKIRFKLKFPGI